MRELITPPNTVVEEGIDAFSENALVIKAALTRPPLTARQLLTFFHPKYHGTDRPGCILVKKRREKTYQEHYLDIYCCFICGPQHECLRSGWEIGWYGGTETKKLK